MRLIYAMIVVAILNSCALNHMFLLPPPISTTPQPPVVDVKIPSIQSICQFAKCTKIGNSCMPKNTLRQIGTIYLDANCSQSATWVAYPIGKDLTAINYVYSPDAQDTDFVSPNGAILGVAAQIKPEAIWYIDPSEKNACKKIPSNMYSKLATNTVIVRLDVAQVARTENLRCD